MTGFRVPPDVDLVPPSHWAGVQSSRAVDALVEAAHHPAGTPQRTEHLRRAQVFASLAVESELRLLRGTLGALGEFAGGVWEELRQRDGDGKVVPLGRRERGRS